MSIDKGIVDDDRIVDETIKKIMLIDDILRSNVNLEISTRLCDRLYYRMMKLDVEVNGSTPWIVDEVMPIKRNCEVELLGKEDLKDKTLEELEKLYASITTSTHFLEDELSRYRLKIERLEYFQMKKMFESDPDKCWWM